jgi:hypothetical protein
MTGPVQIDPASLPDSGLTMSNFNYSADDGLEDALRDGQRGTHAAWNFNGLIWFDPADGQFWERVSRFHVPVATVSAPGLRELMEKVNDEYGWD